MNAIELEIEKVDETTVTVILKTPYKRYSYAIYYVDEPTLLGFIQKRTNELMRRLLLDEAAKSGIK